MSKELEIECPNCGAKVCYRYGSSKLGKKRVQCLMCNRQFVLEGSKTICSGKPRCDVCDSLMYLYKIEGNILRFRCSKYPKCKNYKKFIMLEVE